MTGPLLQEREWGPYFFTLLLSTETAQTDVVGTVVLPCLLLST